MAQMIALDEKLEKLVDKRDADMIDNEWEYNFIASIQSRCEIGGGTSCLSEKQVDKLEQIYLKHFA